MVVARVSTWKIYDPDDRSRRKAVVADRDDSLRSWEKRTAVRDMKRRISEGDLWRRVRVEGKAMTAPTRRRHQTANRRRYARRSGLAGSPKRPQIGF
jgi:hypothetical protein